MTLQTTIPIADYVENGVTLLHAIPFQFGAATDVVCSRIANGVEAMLTLGADYTVTGGSSSTGTVAKTNGGTLGTIFRIKRATTRAQQMDYTAGDAFPAESHEAQLDRLTAVDQEQDVAISDLTNRAVHVPVGESAQTLPTKAQMAGKYLAGDASGNIVPASGTGSDPALRTDLAGDSGFTLVKYRSLQTGAFARGGAAWARLGGVDDNNLFNFIDPLLDDAILDGTNTTALDAYIQAGLNSGRRLRACSGQYLIGQTVVAAANGAGLIGPSAGDLHDTGLPIVAPAILKWAGAAGGTMARVKSGGTQFIADNQFKGFLFDGNSGLAAVGLNLVGCRRGEFDVVGAHFTTALLKMDPDTALSEPQGCTENVIQRLTGYQTNVGDGCLLLETSTASYNCSQNQFGLISGDFRNGYAIDIQGSDSETFELVKLYATLTSAVGIRLKGGPNANQAARNNMFHCVAVTNATVPVFAGGTSSDAVASYENNIVFLDTANNPNLPSIDTGASLWWGTLRSPLGQRSYTAAVGSLVQQDVSGKITQSGISGTVAPNTNTVITLPRAFTTGAMSVSVTPKTAATTFSVSCSATQLTINNAAGGASTDFYWRTEGF